MQKTDSHKQPITTYVLFTVFLTFFTFSLATAQDTLQISLSSTPTGCQNGTDGLVTIDITGGTVPYNIELSPELKRRTPYTTYTFFGVPAGTYEVLVTDQMGLTATGTVTVDSGAAPPVPDTLATLIFQEGCLSECQGMIEIDRYPEYIFRWNGRLMASDTVRRICPGTHTLQIERISEACIVNYSIELPEPPLEEAIPQCPSDTTIQIAAGLCASEFGYGLSEWASEACGVGKNALTTTDMVDDGYGLAGTMFDLRNTSSDTIIITGWDLLLDEGEWDIQIYQTRGASSFVGNIFNGANATNTLHWLFWGQATVNSDGTGSSTHIPVGGMILPPNTSRGFYITSTRDWINGPISLQDSYPGAEVSNCDLRLSAGIGLTNRSGQGFAQDQFDIIFGNTAFTGGSNTNYRLIEAKINYVPISERLYQIDGTGLSSLSVFPVGTTPQVFSFLNDGNVEEDAVCSFNVTVAEPEPPTFTFCPEDFTVEVEGGDCSAVVEYDLPTFTDNCLTRDLSLSLNRTDDITGQARCFNQQTGESPQSAHIRIFDLQNHALVSPFHLSEVEVGISISNGSEPVTLNVYDIHPDSALVYANLNLLQSETFTPPGGSDYIHSIPVSVTVPADRNLVVELIDPEDSEFIAGYTERGNGISYFAGCGFPEPTDLFTINCIRRHFYAKVSGASDLALFLEQTDTTGLSSGDVFPAGATTLEYTATDASGNTAICSFTVTVDGDLTAALTPTATTCVLNEGAIEVLVEGGEEPYFFEWSNGSTEQNQDSLAPGSYFVTITSSNGCSTVAETLVEGPLAPEPIALNILPSLCGNDNGSIETHANGENGPFTFAWNTGSAEPLLTDLAPGIYTLTVTDTLGCVGSANFEVEEIPGPFVTAFESLPTFCGNDNGSVAVVPGGDFGPFTYAWENGSTDSTAVDLPPGFISVAITDSNGCVVTDSVEVLEIPGPAVEFATTSPSLCGGADGTATVLPSGNEPFTFEWESGSTDTTITDLAAGEYLVSVTDGNGCVTVATAVVEDLPGPELSFSATLPTGCIIPDGTATVEAAGTEPFLYLWNNGDTTATATGLLPGVYEVAVTDNNNCVSSGTVTVDEPAGPTLTIVTTPPSTCQESDAVAEVAVEGVWPFSYNWSSGSTDSIATGLSPGAYTVEVTDAVGCVSTAEAIIEVFTDLAIAADSVAAAICGEPNGYIEVGITGGTWPYAFAWSNGAVDSVLTDLPADTFSVVVTDAFGCVTEATYIVEDAASPAIDSFATFTAYCGLPTGSAEVFFSGGTGNLSVLWNNGGVEPAITDLVPGEYSIIVTDSNGCEATGSVVVDNEDGQTLSIELVQQPTACVAEDGSLAVLIGGGFGPFTIEWGTGATTDTITGLIAGAYTVVVIDDQGCEADAEFDLAGFNAIELDWTTTAATCNNNNGTLNANLSGGEGPIEYALLFNGEALESDTADQPFLFFTGLDNGIYELQLSDSTGCVETATIEVAAEDSPVIVPGFTPTTCGQENGEAWVEISGGTYPFTFVWDNGQSDSLLANVPAGEYAIAVLDHNGCISTGTVVVEDLPAPAISVAELLNATCDQQNGAITLDIQSSTPEYTIVWSTGDSTAVIDSLLSGVFSVSVTDANGCFSILDSLVVEIASDTLAPEFVVCPTEVVVVSCVPEVEYDLPEAIDNCEFATELIEGFPSGSAFPADTTTVTYQATDLAGNTTLCSFPVIRIEDLGGEISSEPISCFDAEDGAATLLITGGTAPYDILWSTGDTTETISGLTAGSYSATVSDQGGCVVETTLTLEAPSAISIALDSIVPETPPCENGAISITPGGGTPGYTFLWSNLDDPDFSADTEDLDSIVGGVYEVEITDANGCVQVSSPFIVQQDTSCTISAVDELGDLNEVFVLFPNPTNGLVNVQLKAPNPEEAEFSLFDLRGVELTRFSGQWLAEQQLILDLSAYANGSYWLRMKTQRGVWTLKIVLSR
jgi:hypothetical protein